MEMTPENITKISENYHKWQQMGNEENYKNIPEYCYSASFDEIKENDFSLVPSRYIEFVDRDIDEDFDTEMKRIQTEFEDILQTEKRSQEDLMKAFKELGYEIKL